MPAKNSVKMYIDNGYYHIYNRGVNKRTIFKKKIDYKVFLNELKAALTPPPKPNDLKVLFTLKGGTFKGIPRQPKNFHKEIMLLAYCLMPNHFHLLIRQLSKNSMPSFMRSITTRYAMYFNTNNRRIGPLFQGSYKAVLIEDDNHFLHLTRYIHQNPLKLREGRLKDYPYSSYAEYLGLRNTSWIHPEDILAFFRKRRREKKFDISTYETFVDSQDNKTQEVLKGLTLD